MLTNVGPIAGPDAGKTTEKAAERNSAKTAERTDEREAFFLFAPIRIKGTRGGYGRALAVRL